MRNAVTVFALKKSLCLFVIFSNVLVISRQTYNLYFYILHLWLKGFIHETSHTDLASAASFENEMKELVKMVNTSYDLELTSCEFKTKSTS